MVVTSQQTQSGAGADVASTSKASKRAGPIARKSLAVQVMKDRGSDRHQRAFDELISARPNCLDKFSVDDDDQFKQGMFRALRRAKVSWTIQHFEETCRPTAPVMLAAAAVVTAALTFCYLASACPRLADAVFAGCWLRPEAIATDAGYAFKPYECVGKHVFLQPCVCRGW
jgi:hypothetical protein